MVQQFRRTSIFVFFIIITLLVGCSSHLETPPPFLSDYSSSVKDINDSDIKLKMLTTFDGPFASSGVGFKSGYYSLKFNDDGSANIMYTDISSRKTIYLSSQLTSSHDDSSDTSWIKDGATFLFVDDSSLYFSQNFAGNNANCNDKIWRLDLNGGNRDLLIELNSNQRLTHSVATDGTFFYTTIETVSQDASSTYALYRIAISNGQIKKILDLSSNEILIGSYNDCLIFKSAPSSMDTTYSLFLVSLRDYEKSVVLTWEPGTHYGSIYNNHYYYIDYKPGEKSAHLYSLNLDTLNILPVSLNIPIEKDFSATIFSGIYDNHFLYYVGTENSNNNFDMEYVGYGISLTDGTVKKVSLSCAFQGKTYVKILWEFENFFLVRNGENIETKVLEAPDGSSYSATISSPLWSLIEKKDFWNNHPIYLPISS